MKEMEPWPIPEKMTGDEPKQNESGRKVLMYLLVLYCNSVFVRHQLRLFGLPCTSQKVCTLKQFACTMSNNVQLDRLRDFFACNLIITYSFPTHASICTISTFHDDVIKWKHLPRYWPFVRGIQRAPVNSPRKGQWRGNLMFSFICAWINAWVNNHVAGNLRSHRAHYDAILMVYAAYSRILHLSMYCAKFYSLDRR